MTEKSARGRPGGAGPGDLRSLWFTRIELRNWRNFTAADAPLRPRMFLVGPNAAGKSNFLDAFRFLADIASVGGGFQDAVRRRGGVSALRSLAARQHPAISVVATLGNDQAPDEWVYELTFGQDNQRRAGVVREVVRHGGTVLLKRPDRDDDADPERLRQTHLEQVNVNRSFRGVADFFRTIRYRHIVPQLVREPDRSVGKTDDPFGGDFLEQIARTTKRTTDSRLRAILKALKVAVPQLDALELYRDSSGTPHLRGRYQHWRRNGAWQSEEQFSDGTLRLLGLLWSVAEPGGPLLLEEPELSLHPEVVRHIPQMFARVQRRRPSRQILVSSHSTDMLSDSGLGDDEILTLVPAKEGTSVELLANQPGLRDRREAGVDLAEILRAATAPSDAAQLSLFNT